MIAIIVAAAGVTVSLMLGIYGVRRSVGRDAIDDERAYSQRQAEAIRTLEVKLEKVERRLEQCSEDNLQKNAEIYKLYQHNSALQERVERLEKGASS